jgi:hypothetical protein
MGSSPDLVANWTFDQTAQGVVAGGTNSGFTAVDMSGNNNQGNLIGFALSGPASNFVNNFCPPPYQLNINDINFPAINLTSICSGDPAQFCVTQNGLPVSLPGGATVQWEYFDINAGNPWLPVPVTSNTFQSLCFGVPKGGLDISNTIACDPNIGAGFVDRKYRAIITKTVNGLSCVYTTSEYGLQVCCPPQSCTSLQLVSQPIAAPLCEGDLVTLSASINFCDNWLQLPSPNITIDWYLIDGQNPPQLLPYPNFGSIIHTVTVGTNDICIQAKISNCTCPELVLEQCIAVDPIPKCGVIAPMAGTSSLCADPDGIVNHYLICPGDEVTLEMVSPFTDCNPVWQYRFDTSPPNTWTDLGSSNSSQNTNGIPQVNPPNWPAGTSYIFYRIECQPLSWPNSGCDPCYSNEIRVGLKPPLAKPIIAVPANQICKGDPAYFSVTNNYPGTPQFEWFCNAESQGTPGQYFNAFQQACYWVEVSDGCYQEESEKECIEVCEVVPIIKCPEDNPCACLGQPITLSGCDSYNTCDTGPLPLLFMWSNSSTIPCTLSGPNNCLCTHIPNAAGTTYTLTVTDQNLGCTATTTFFIEPCF